MTCGVLCLRKPLRATYKEMLASSLPTRHHVQQASDQPWGYFLGVSGCVHVSGTPVCSRPAGVTHVGLSRAAPCPQTKKELLREHLFWQVQGFYYMGFQHPLGKRQCGTDGGQVDPKGKRHRLREKPLWHLLWRSHRCLEHPHHCEACRAPGQWAWQCPSRGLWPSHQGAANSPCKDCCERVSDGQESKSTSTTTSVHKGGCPCCFVFWCG